MSEAIVEPDPTYPFSDPDIDWSQIPALAGENAARDRTLSEHSSLIYQDEETVELMRLVPSQALMVPDDKNLTQPTLVSSENSTQSTLGKRASRDTLEDASPQPANKVRRLDSDIFLDSNRSSTRDVVPEIEPDVDTLAPVFIAYDRHLQAAYDSRKLSIGVQWEISWLLTNGKITHDEILINSLSELQGTNAEKAPKTRKVILGKKIENSHLDAAFHRERKLNDPWTHLDREETASTNASLGCCDSTPDWYGGQVHFSACLKSIKNSDSFTLRLERASVGPSYRFARRFGSKSFIRVKIPKSIGSKRSRDVIRFFQQPIVIIGRVYRAYYRKDDRVFLFRTNETVTKHAIDPVKTTTDSISLLDFIEFHNSFKLNSKQTAAKYVSRFALGLSNSAPGLLISPNCIEDIPDVVSTEGCDMTDGAGLINRAGLKLLQRRFNWDHFPTAIQCRVAGYKGLLVLTFKDEDPTPRIWLRPSQKKIRYSNLDDPCLRIIEVLRASHCRPSSRLSAETIINLWHNGVPADVFKTLFENSLEEAIEPFLQWEGEENLRRLWATVAVAGGVLSARDAQEYAGLARLKGCAVKDADELEEDEENQQLDPLEQGSLAWWVDEISGSPSSLEETVMYLLDSGFTPKNCSVLRSQLHLVIKKAIATRASHIDLPMSATAFLVPDETGVLKAGEIFFRSSQRNLVGVDGIATDIVLGDVLVTRHPCKLPTDVQKWRAIDHPLLRQTYSDVIVCSVDGHRRAADYLAGGDYDGDKGLLIYDPMIVGPFKNAHENVSPSPTQEQINSWFSKSILSVDELLQDAAQTQINLQEYLLGGKGDLSLVGKYSNMHDVCVYERGYDDPDSIRLAYIFCLILDSVKSGLTLLPDVLREDERRFRKILQWKKDPVKETDYVQSNDPSAKRPRRLGPFIMDTLKDLSKELTGRFYARAQVQCVTNWKHIRDLDLEKPWNDHLDIAQKCAQQGFNGKLEALDKIKQHVEAIFEKHRALITAQHGNQPVSPSKRTSHSFTELSIETRQDALRKLSKEFASQPLVEDLIYYTEDEAKNLKASYAYIHDNQRGQNGAGWTRFPWNVSMRGLCDIKAKALGSHKTVCSDFYRWMKVRTKR